MDGRRFHSSHGGHRGTIEPQEDSQPGFHTAFHRLRLGPQRPNSLPPQGETRRHLSTSNSMAGGRCNILASRHLVATWQTSTCSLYFPTYPPILAVYLFLRYIIQIPSCSSSGGADSGKGSFLDPVHLAPHAQYHAAVTIHTFRYWLVGGCQHILWDWHCCSQHMGNMVLGTWFCGRTKTGARYWLGRGRCSGNGPTTSIVYRRDIRVNTWHYTQCSLRQFRCGWCTEKRSLSESDNKHCAAPYLRPPCNLPHLPWTCIRSKPRQHIRRFVQRQYQHVPTRVPWRICYEQGWRSPIGDSGAAERSKYRSEL